MAEGSGARTAADGFIVTEFYGRILSMSQSISNGSLDACWLLTVTAEAEIIHT